jgi:hypothetical protein
MFRFDLTLLKSINYIAVSTISLWSRFSPYNKRKIDYFTLSYVKGRTFEQNTIEQVANFSQQSTLSLIT